MGATRRRVLWGAVAAAVVAVGAVRVVPLATSPAASASFRHPGARDVTGELDGARYRIVVPERWNGTLVVFAHGYTGRGSAPTITELVVPRAGDEGPRELRFEQLGGQDRCHATPILRARDAT